MRKTMFLVSLVLTVSLGRHLLAQWEVWSSAAKVVVLLLLGMASTSTLLAGGLFDMTEEE